MGLPSNSHHVAYRFVARCRSTASVERAPTLATDKRVNARIRNIDLSFHFPQITTHLKEWMDIFPIMALDFHTLFVTIILVSIALSTIWGTISWLYRSFHAARIWCAASVLTATGGLLLPFQSPNSIVMSASGNGVAILGVWLLWLGLRRFHGMNGGWQLVGLATATCVLLTVVFHQAEAAIVLVHEVGKSVPMFMSMIHLLDRSRRTAGAVLSCAGIVVGLMGHGVEAAMIIASSTGVSSPLSVAVVGSFSMMSVIFSGVLWNFGLAVMTIEILRNEVAALANIDPLTAVSNRRKFDEILAAENVKSARSGRPYALLLLDLDHFKAVNDRLGHKGGDASLVHMVKVVQGCIRRSDVLARLGGDEFCILMTDTTEPEARAVGLRIVQALRDNPLHFEQKEVTLSCSMGIGIWSAETNGIPDAVFSRADRALYSVKHNGRNGIAFAPSLAPDDAALFSANESNQINMQNQ